MSLSENKIQIDFVKLGELVPAIIQDVDSREVLMLGYMNEEALRLTQENKRVTFFSRSKNRIWVKGESSKNYLNVVSVKQDCDNDAILVLARPEGPTCHRGTKSCFSTDDKDAGSSSFLPRLQEIIKQRLQDKPEDSYTAKLAASGVHKIAQKVGEEAVEVVIEALRADKALLKEEAADLFFHYLVLLEVCGVSFDSVLERLRERNEEKKSVK